MNLTTESVICTASDVWSALVLGLLAIALLATACSVSGLDPMWAIPAVAAWCSAWLLPAIQFRRGIRDTTALRLPLKEFRNWALSALVFSFVMPAIFPNDAYERNPWLIWVNASLLLGAILAIPFAKLITFLIGVFATRRAESAKRGGRSGGDK
jgi:hypothetical protein